jgi:hypothetical protein
VRLHAPSAFYGVGSRHQRRSSNRRVAERPCGGAGEGRLRLA